MDAYEATKIVFSRIQNLDPENASKIIGRLLIQDHGDKEMIRLAFGPESLVHSVILKVRKELGLSSSTPSPPLTPSSPLPFLSNNNSISLSRQNSSCSLLSSRLPSPLSIPSSWGASCFSDFKNTEDLIGTPNSSTSLYATATATDNGISNLLMGSSSASINSSASPFYGSGGTDLVDEFQLQDQLSFLNEGSPTPKIPDLFYPQPDLASSPSGNGDVLFSSYGGAALNWNSVPHRRSCSVSDTLLGTEDPAGAFGWKPCLYFARGYCKNGNSCRFFHGSLADPVDGAAMVGSPSKLEMMDQCQELLRSKSAHQQRMATASHLMASTFPYSAAAANKCMNFLLQQQQSDSQRAAVASMMGEDMHKLGRYGAGILNPSSRQIYLTFPADSTFREEDVSNYFSIFGPVQDVRIPYQQKRMFGFVTFLYPETVKLILAKGNPHFVCDARVLVKPYKEKGKVPDKKLQPQEMERGEFLTCGSPTGLDSRDPYDLQLGSGIFYNTQDMLWRRKLEEQADLQQAIDLQGRRLMGLQLLDAKRYNQRRALTTGAAIPSPTQSSNFFDQCLVLSADHSSQDVTQENGSNPAMATSATAAADQPANVTEKERESSTSNEENGNGKESPHNEESELQENLEHNLPDNPFASPKAPGDYITAYSNAAGEAERNAAVSATSSVSNTLITPSLLPAPSTLDMAGVNSCYFQMPRFSSGHGAIGL